MELPLDAVRLHQAITQAREKRGWNCREISKRAAVDNGHTSRLLNGKFKRVSRQLQAICDVLEVDPKKYQKGHVDQWPTVEKSVRAFVGNSKSRASLLMSVMTFLNEVKAHKPIKPI
jgi:DNA-binding Xre family transcriptional regulator